MAIYLRKELSTRRMLNNMKIVDTMILVLLGITMVAITIHKARKEMLIFLLQPCHMNAFALLALFLMDIKNYATHFAFNVILHLNWGAVLALVTPDLRDYEQFLEVEFFWIEHALLLIIPFYCIMSKRFAVFESTLTLACASFFLLAVYHSFVLSAASLWTGINLNYLLAPPPGILFTNI